jgi:hypothetical protein
MHQKTSKIKSKIRNASTLKEKIAILSNSYKDVDCVILTAGPSINDIELSQLRKFLKNKVIIAVKQTYNLVPDLVDIHLINTDNYQLYDFLENDPIKIKVSVDGIRAKTPCYHEDLNFFINKSVAVDKKDSLAYTREFAKYKILDSISRPWGPGIMYEIGVYLPQLLGCGKLFVIGWDLGVRKSDNIPRFYEKKSVLNLLETFFKQKMPNFYNEILLRFINKFNSFRFIFNKSVVLNKPVISRNEASFICDSSFELYQWLLSESVEMFVISERSMLDSRITRIQLGK